MQGDATVIEHMNRVLKNELTAINQYFLHSRIYKDWGISKLADHEHDESIDEMKHADSLIERTLFLEGLPNLQNLGKLRIGEDVEEMLQCDLDLELDALPDLQAGIAYCEKIKDYVSRDLFDSILQSEEEHVDWLEILVEIILPAGTQAFSWWTGVAFNTTSAWFQAFDDSGNDTGRQYFSAGPGYSEKDYVTAGFGVSTGQCSSITKIIVEPNYWGVGNFSINQDPCITVPEPAPLALFGIGLLAMALTRKIVRPVRQT